MVIVSPATLPPAALRASALYLESHGTEESAKRGVGVGYIWLVQGIKHHHHPQDFTSLYLTLPAYQKAKKRKRATLSPTASLASGMVVGEH